VGVVVRLVVGAVVAVRLVVAEGSGVGCTGTTRRGRVAPDCAAACVAKPPSMSAATATTAAKLIRVLIMTESFSQLEG
jgi:hypothetical protein